MILGELLLVGLHGIGRADLRLVGVEPRRGPCLALVEQVIAPVELDLDRVEPVPFLLVEAAAVAGRRPELFLLGRQLVDGLEEIEISHCSPNHTEVCVTGAIKAPVPFESPDQPVLPTRNGMDIDLVIRAQRGDEEAFASLAVAAGDRLHAVAHRILRDIELAEDATQQALLNVWRDLPQLRDPARFDAWSYRLLVRACYAEGRRTRQWTPNLRLLPADEPEVAEGLSSVVDRDQLERGFRRLSIDHRAVVVLHHYLDLPLDEIADLLGVPVGTVRSRLLHAMRGLRAAIEADARPTKREVAQ